MCPPFCPPSRGTILTGRHHFDIRWSAIPLPTPARTTWGCLRRKSPLPKSFGNVDIKPRFSANGTPVTVPPGSPALKASMFTRAFYSNDMFLVQTVRNEEVIQYPVPQSTLTRRCTDLAIDYIQSHQNDPFFYTSQWLCHTNLWLYPTPFTRPHARRSLCRRHCRTRPLVGEFSIRLRNSIYRRNLGHLHLGQRSFLWRLQRPTAGHEGQDLGRRAPRTDDRLDAGFDSAGIISDQPAGTIDILPTICQLAGTSQPLIVQSTAKTFGPF